MSYKNGDVKVTTECEHPECEGDKSCYINGTEAWVHDARPPKGAKTEYPRGVYLPHSCDEWYIGGRAEVEQMIADLTAALGDLP